MRALWYRFEFRHRQPKQKGQTSCKPNMQFTLDKHLLRSQWWISLQSISKQFRLQNGDMILQYFSSHPVPMVIFAPWPQQLQKLCCIPSYDTGSVHLVSFLLWQKRHSWNPQGQGPKLQSVQVCCSFHLRPALRNGCWEGGLLGDTELLWQGLSSTSSASAAVT